MENFLDLLKELDHHKVSFVIVGGMAAVIHGGSMVTQDVDLCLDFSLSNLERLNNAVEPLHPVHRMLPDRPAFRWEPERYAGLKNLYLDTDWGILDCLGEVAGVGDYKSVRDQSEAITVDGQAFRVLTLDALIQAKRAMGRTKDLAAVRELEWIKSQR